MGFKQSCNKKLAQAEQALAAENTTLGIHSMQHM